MSLQRTIFRGNAIKLFLVALSMKVLIDVLSVLLVSKSINPQDCASDKKLLTLLNKKLRLSPKQKFLIM